VAVEGDGEQVAQRDGDPPLVDGRPSALRGRENDLPERTDTGSYIQGHAIARAASSIFTPSDRVGALLLRSDADEPVDVGDPHLAVADLAGRRGTNNDVDDALDVAVVDDDVEA
jgi:hypothetical protein